MWGGRPGPASAGLASTHTHPPRLAMAPAIPPITSFLHTRWLRTGTADDRDTTMVNKTNYFEVFHKRSDDIGTVAHKQSDDWEKERP